MASLSSLYNNVREVKKINVQQACKQLGMFEDARKCFSILRLSTQATPSDAYSYLIQLLLGGG